MTIIRVELPLPEGRTPDGGLYWRLSSGELIIALDDAVYSPGLPSHTDRPAQALRQDAAIMLAAASYTSTRTGAHT